ncbi:hypothetical protein A2U01_0100055, partial [Trifolium medium]|nr:hypothetical protein [Trifolium medium]
MHCHNITLTSGSKSKAASSASNQPPPLTVKQEPG